MLLNCKIDDDDDSIKNNNKGEWKRGKNFIFYRLHQQLYTTFLNNIIGYNINLYLRMVDII